MYTAPCALSTDIYTCDTMHVADVQFLICAVHAEHPQKACCLVAYTFGME